MNRLNGFLFMDLLSKSLWANANEKLHYYKDQSPGSRRKFGQAVQDYVGIHGKVKIDKVGNNADICFPRYNAIPDFLSKYGEFFIIV